MGGMLACHLAKKGMVDYMFADRAFSNLEDVPIYSYGLWSKYSMRLFTMWENKECTQDYIFANCYKVLAADPNDEIINDNVSLKTGVSLKIVRIGIITNIDS